MPDHPSTGSRRETAEANRQRLLAAAEELFAARGLSVTLNDVAHHAGVGVGTAYRRFANKQELVDALIARRLDEAVALANESLADPDAWHGLTTFLQRSLEGEVQNRGMGQMVNNLHIHPDQRWVDVWRDRLAPLLERLIERAKDQGHLRPDVVAADAIVLRAALTTVVDMSRDTAPDVYRRYLTIVLDGLRADPGTPTPLPVDALSTSESHSSMASTRWRPTGPGPERLATDGPPPMPRRSPADS